MSPAAPTLPPLEDEIAPPRSNGEPVFDAPWESRAFGMVVSLHQRGAFEWDEFRDLLIDEVARSERQGGRPYYESWLAAFQRLAIDKDLLTADEFASRQREFMSGERRDVY
jgi:nitrile hydratase accessory protein